MNANQVNAYVAQKYPGANKSPLAMMFSGVIASDEADRAIDFAQLQAKASKAQMRREAFQHALDCIDANDEHDEESVSTNTECHFPELGMDECDDLAEQAFAHRKPA